MDLPRLPPTLQRRLRKEVNEAIAICAEWLLVRALHVPEVFKMRYNATTGRQEVRRLEHDTLDLPSLPGGLDSKRIEDGVSIIALSTSTSNIL